MLGFESCYPEWNEKFIVFYTPPRPVITFPRNTPDKIEIDGEKVEFKPSELNSVSTRSLPSRTFNQAVIETHCSSCLKKQSLRYSDMFPSRITFVCNGCEEQNKVVNIRRDNRNYSRLSEITRRMRKRVRERETRVAGMKYASRRPEEVSTVVSDYEMVKSKRGVMFGIAFFVSVLILYSMTLPFISPILAIVGTAIIIGVSTFLTYEIQPNLPEDPYIRLKSREFVEGMKSVNEIASEFHIEKEQESGEEPRNVEKQLNN